jgi:hypothetical protein
MGKKVHLVRGEYFLFLGAFPTKLRKVTISLVMSVCLFALTKKHETRRIHCG